MFDLALILRGPSHELLVAGLVRSLELAAITWVFALPLATGVAVLRLAPWRPLRWLGFIYVEGVRSIPLLAHMLFWYFGAPELLPDALKTRLYEGPVETISAVLALTFYTAAYMAEDIRSGIRSVSPGQFMAAEALGLGFVASMRLVILPQATRRMVPPLISQTLNLWKNTSIATVIGVAELMYRAAQVETATFRSFEAFAFASTCYLAVSLVISGLAAWYQHRVPVRHV